MRIAIVVAAALLMALPADLLSQEVVVLTGVAVGVPRLPNEQSWDDVLSLPGGVTSLYPDIRVCLQSEHVPYGCLPVCPNAEWVESSAAFVCRHRVQILAETDMDFAIDDVDGSRGQLVWRGTLPNPGTCVGKACRFDLPGGALQIEFTIARMNFADYKGPFQGTLGPPPAPAPTPAPRPAPAPAPRAQPAAPTPSLWERVKQGWERVTSYFSPADAVEAFCTARSGIIGWACGYFVAGPVRTTDTKNFSRIACYREALGSGPARQAAETACRSYPDGSAGLETCLTMYLDPLPDSCLANSDVQEPK